jgi:hypothetical protein
MLWNCERCGKIGNEGVWCERCGGNSRQKASCKKCGTPLKPDGKCGDVTCPYSDRQQDETYSEG